MTIRVPLGTTFTRSQKSSTDKGMGATTKFWGSRKFLRKMWKFDKTIEELPLRLYWMPSISRANLFKNLPDEENNIKSLSRTIFIKNNLVTRKNIRKTIKTFNLIFSFFIRLTKATKQMVTKYSKIKILPESEYGLIIQKKVVPSKFIFTKTLTSKGKSKLRKKTEILLLLKNIL
jgi:hypothetical protein